MVAERRPRCRQQCRTERPKPVAPFIYFDLVPNFGFNVGVANLTLEVMRFTMAAVGKVGRERLAVAHLRTSIEGLRQLKAAIGGIEAIIQRPADSEKTKVRSL